MRSLLALGVVVMSATSLTGQDYVTNKLKNNERLNANSELKSAQAFTNSDGGTIKRFQHYFKGIKVWGSTYTVKENQEDVKLLSRGYDDPRLEGLQIEPTLSSAEALGIADISLPKAIKSLAHPANETANSFVMDVQHVTDPEVELVVFPVEKQTVKRSAARKPYWKLNAEDFEYPVTGYRLAYHVATHTEMNEQEAAVNFLIDAHTGEVIKKWNMVKFNVHKGTVNSKYSGPVTLFTQQNTLGQFETRDALYANYVTGKDNLVFKDEDNTWGNGGNYLDGTPESVQTGAAEALYALQRTAQMLENVYGRKGFDGVDGKMRLIWGKVAAGGTGCAVNVNIIYSGYEDNNFTDMNKVDVMAHEYGHAFDYRTSRLCNDDTGEAGGMSEAHADIIAVLAEAYCKYTAHVATGAATEIPEEALNDPGLWVMADGAAKARMNGGKGLRFFDRPSDDRFEGGVNAWYPGISNLNVHGAAGPVSRMFYYMAVGAPADPNHRAYTSYLPKGSKGVGLHKAGMIWVKTMMSGRLSQASKHMDARNACIAVASELYGSNSSEVDAVTAGWAGVNVGTYTPSTIKVEIRPGEVTLASGANQSFEFLKDGQPVQATWTVTNGGGSFIGNVFTAPYVKEDAVTTIKAVSDDGLGAVATITVLAEVINPDANLILNGGFEKGVESWVGNVEAIKTWDKQPASEGLVCAWLGGKGKKGTETLAQIVSLPADATKVDLDFMLHVDTSEMNKYTAYDKLTVDLLDATGKRLKTLKTFSNQDKLAGYKLHTFDLTPYKGQTVQIKFTSTEDVSNQTSFVLDDIKVIKK